MNESSNAAASALAPFAGFREAADATLSMLRQRSGLPAWLFTRVAGDDWLILAAAADSFDLHAGDALRWSDSVCSRMLAEGGPRFTADIDATAAYRDAPVVACLGIRTYMGVPVELDDGAVGTLCAIGAQPAPAEAAGWLPVVEVCARALATLWRHSTDLERTRRRAERAELEAMTDPMTGLYNRRGWQLLLDLEESRCRDAHRSAGVVAVDLDELKRVNDRHGHEAGDALIGEAARQLQATVRPGDAVARLGGDEFGLLLVGVGPTQLAQAAQRVERRLAAAGVAATVSCSWRGPGRDLAETFHDADLLLIDAKRARPQRSH